MIINRRAHMRLKTLEECQKECSSKVPFQQKNKYIETRLEQGLKYFDYMNDYNNPGIEAQKLRKELFRIARTDAKKSQGADPYTVIENVSIKEKSFED